MQLGKASLSRLSVLVGHTGELVSLALSAPPEKKKKSSVAARQEMLEGSVGVIARLVAAGRQDMLTFIVKSHPVTTVSFSTFFPTLALMHFAKI